MTILTLYIKTMQTAIDKASEKYGVESSLIKAVIQAESAFNHKATSSKGATGPYAAYALYRRLPVG